MSIPAQAGNQALSSCDTGTSLRMAPSWASISLRMPPVIFFDLHEITSGHAAITHLRISKLIAESESNEPNVSARQRRAIKFAFRFLIDPGLPCGPAFSAGGPEDRRSAIDSKKQRGDCSAALLVS